MATVKCRNCGTLLSAQLSACAMCGTPNGNLGDSPVKHQEVGGGGNGARRAPRMERLFGNYAVLFEGVRWRAVLISGVVGFLLMVVGAVILSLWSGSEYVVDEMPWHLLLIFSASWFIAGVVGAAMARGREINTGGVAAAVAKVLDSVLAPVIGIPFDSSGLMLAVSIAFLFGTLGGGLVRLTRGTSEVRAEPNQEAHEM